MSRIQNHCKNHFRRSGKDAYLSSKYSHFGRIKKKNRQKVLRKPKDLKPEYPGNLVALDTIEKFVNGTRRYIITFEDIYTRFSFAWATKATLRWQPKSSSDFARKLFRIRLTFCGCSQTMVRNSKNIFLKKSVN